MMKEQEIKGIKENLLFYYPIGSDRMMAQRYNVETDELVYEKEITGQYMYDMTLSVFRMFNNPTKMENTDPIVEFFGFNNPTKMENTDPIVEFFDLEFSEGAVEWIDENGKIKDIDKLHRYMTEAFKDPLYYVLQTFNEYLAEPK